MSVVKNYELRRVAVERCRRLRRNSTEAERILWEILRNRKFRDKKFYRQKPIYYDLLGKGSFYIADFYCHEEKLVVEVDGGIHENQKDEDVQRTEVMSFLGLNVIRFQNEDIENNIEEVLEALGEILK